MIDTLSTGAGRCVCTARVILSPSRMAIELGAGKDVFDKVTAAIHHENRNGPQDDRIAIAFPGLSKGRGMDKIGADIEAYGSEAALSRLLANDFVRQLTRRSAITSPEIYDVYMDEGETGTAFVRVQTGMKSTPAGIERARRRFEKRAHLHDAPWVDRPHQGAGISKDLPFLMVSGKRITFEAVVAPCATELMVSTYGFATRAHAAGLPLLLAHHEIAA